MAPKNLRSEVGGTVPYDFIPRTRQPLVVGRVELTRTPTLRTDPPVPGSRLGTLEARVAKLELDCLNLQEAMRLAVIRLNTLEKGRRRPARRRK